MAVRFQVTVDCADPARLADFWTQALGYKPAGPPDGFSSWEEWFIKMGVPEEEWNEGAKIADPDGDGPTMYFQQVPEPKLTKNRLHLDLDVSSGPRAPLGRRREEISSEAERLVALGATRLVEYEQADHFHIVMQDPEGNEFCLR